MAELKIIISGDASGATKALDDVKNSSDYTYKSISTLVANLKKADKSFQENKIGADDLEKAQKQLLNAFERFSNAALTGKDSMKAYNDILNKSDYIIQAILANTKTADLAKPFIEARDQAEEYKKILEEVQAKSAETLKRNKATALGDTGALAKMDYSELDSRLTKVLEREGKVTDEARVLAKEMNKLKIEMDKAGKTDLATRMKNLATSFMSAQVAVWAIQKGLYSLKKVLVDSAEAASKAEETANLFNTTFSNIQTTANNTASALSSSLGVATSSAQQMIGLFGDLAMGYGQTQSAALEFANQAVKTGLDIISFKNLTGDTTELLQSMASGLAGNFENFRKWGIIVTQTEIKQRLAQKGLDKLTGSAYQYAKVQETLAIVQEKSKNATGDMEKTLDSTENITRRMGEANKELMETMGSSVNTILNPVKLLWLDIATSINKANKAQREYAAGSKNIKVYDIANNGKDAKSFERSIAQGGTIMYGTSGRTSLSNDDASMDAFISNAKTQMVKYNATLDETLAVIRDNISLKWDGQFQRIESELKAFADNLEKEVKAQEALEARKSKLESSATSGQNFIDSLAGIQGVKTTASAGSYTNQSWAHSDRTLAIALKGVDTQMQKAIDDAIASIDASVWEDFADPIKLALGEVTEDKGLESKLDAIAQIYELIYNESLKNGELTESEKENLDAIVKSYKEIKDLQARSASLSSIMGNITGSSKDSETSRLGLSGMNLDLFNLDEFKRAAEALDLTADEQAKLNAEYEKAKGSINSYYKELAKQENAEKFASALEVLEQKFTESSLELIHLQTGMSDASIEMEEFIQSYQEMLDGMDLTDDQADTLAAAFDKATKAMRDLNTETERQALLEESAARAKSAQNDIQSLQEQVNTHGMNSYEKQKYEINQGKKNGTYTSEEATQMEALVNQLKGLDEAAESADFINSSLSSMFGEAFTGMQAIQNIMSGIFDSSLIGILIDLVTQTEACQQLMSIISDSVLPVLNACLEPLLPIIQQISDILQYLAVYVLTPFFPILKLISEACVIAMGAVKIAVGAISDSMKWLIGNIASFFLTVYNWIVGKLRSINIFGWRPFGSMAYADTSWADEWKSTDVLGNINKNTQDMYDKLEEIHNMTMDIESNTEDKTDTSAYDEMYKNGVLSYAEYTALLTKLNGKNYDNVYTLNGADYYNGRGNTTTVYNGGVTISINGSNKSAEKIAQEVAKILEEKKRSGAQSYA